jgi:hypothetical protein
VGSNPPVLLKKKSFRNFAESLILASYFQKFHEWGIRQLSVLTIEALTNVFGLAVHMACYLRAMESCPPQFIIADVGSYFWSIACLMGCSC